MSVSVTIVLTHQEATMIAQQDWRVLSPVSQTVVRLTQEALKNQKDSDLCF